MKRTISTAVLAAFLALAAPTAWAENSKAVVYKSPTCGCCSKWIDHLEKNGFEVEAKDVPDVTPIKRANGVPPRLAACHTAMVGGYFIEGSRARGRCEATPQRTTGNRRTDGSRDAHGLARHGGTALGALSRVGRRPRRQDLEPSPPTDPDTSRSAADQSKTLA